MAKIIRRHINCADTRCSSCFNDAIKLERLLQKKTNTGNEYDLLGRYHNWLADNNIPNETKEGWPTEQNYEEDNINLFCEEFVKAVE